MCFKILWYIVNIPILQAIQNIKTSIVVITTNLILFGLLFITYLSQELTIYAIFLFQTTVLLSYIAYLIKNKHELTDKFMRPINCVLSSFILIVIIISFYLVLVETI